MSESHRAWKWGAAAIVVGLATVITMTQLRAGSSAPCPPDDPVARNALTLLLTASYLAETRTTAGLDGVDPANLRIVTTSKTCNELKKRIKNDYDVQGGNSALVATFYAVDNRFLAYIVPRENPPESADKSIILVFDQNLQQLETLIF